MFLYVLVIFTKIQATVNRSILTLCHFCFYLRGGGGYCFYIEPEICMPIEEKENICNKRHVKNILVVSLHNCMGK